jgi:spore coat protein U-like protein
MTKLLNAHVARVAPDRIRAGLVVCAGFAAALAMPHQAIAATTPSTMDVTTTVQATCLNTVTPLAFGVYTGALSQITATITVTCTNTTPYAVGLSAGLAPSATVTTRALTGPASALLNYTLTSDAGYSVNWGVTSGTDTVAGTGNGAGQAITVYGQEAAGQYVAPGTYTDTITATVTY